MYSHEFSGVMGHRLTGFVEEVALLPPQVTASFSKVNAISRPRFDFASFVVPGIATSQVPVCRHSLVSLENTLCRSYAWSSLNVK
jgi:hypothetical protein